MSDQIPPASFSWKDECTRMFVRCPEYVGDHLKQNVPLPKCIIDNFDLLTPSCLDLVLKFIHVHPELIDNLVSSGYNFRNAPYNFRHHQYHLCNLWRQPKVAIAAMTHPKIDPRDRQAILEAAPTVQMLLNVLFDLETRGINLFGRNFYYLVDYVCNNHWYQFNEHDLRARVKNKIVDILEDLGTDESIYQCHIEWIKDSFRDVDNNIFKYHPGYPKHTDDPDDVNNSGSKIKSLVMKFKKTGMFSLDSWNNIRFFSDERDYIKHYGMKDTQTELLSQLHQSGNLCPLNHSKVAGKSNTFACREEFCHGQGTRGALLFISRIRSSYWPDQNGKIEITEQELQALCYIDTSSFCPLFIIPHDVRKALSTYTGYVFSAIVILGLRTKSKDVLCNLVKMYHKINLATDLVLDVAYSFQHDTWKFILDNINLFDIEGSMPVILECPYTDVLVELLLKARPLTSSVDIVLLICGLHPNEIADLIVKYRFDQAMCREISKVLDDTRKLMISRRLAELSQKAEHNRLMIVNLLIYWISIEKYLVRSQHIGN